MRVLIRTGAIAIAALLFAGHAASAQTVDDIVAKNLQAKGGVEKLKSMNSVRITGTVEAQGMQMKMTTWAKRPNVFRREMQLPAQGGGDAQKIVNGYDGTTVWMINPLMGSGEVQELSGPAADAAKGDADFDPVFLDYKAKGHTLELVGTETLDGKKVHHLKLTKKNGQIQQLYLDAETGLEVRSVATLEQGGMKADITTDFSNYKNVEGRNTPFTLKQSMNGNPVAQVNIDSVEINVPIDDALFKKPAAKD